MSIRRATITASLAIGTLSAMAGNAGAVNCYFLPGDSFFHAVLTEDSLRRIEKEKAPVFFYDRPESLPSFFCGYAGYRRLEFVSMPERFKKNLRLVYETLREDYPKRIEIVAEGGFAKVDGESFEVPKGKTVKVEINGFSVLFYNSSFDFNKRRLCLKYNENWVKEAGGAEHARYDYFVPLARAVMEEWRDSKAIKALSAEIPKRKAGGKPLFETPVRVRSGIRAIILPNANFKDFYNRKESATFYEVTETGVKEYTSDGREWKLTRRLRPTESKKR